MLESIQAIILGAVQGLTEFLPVSSSGHLELGKVLLGSELKGEGSLLMTVVLHFATALSTIVVFREDVGRLCHGLWQFRWNEDTQFVVKIMISMIPAVVIGLGFQDTIESWFTGNLVLVGTMLLATGLLLFLAGRAQATDRPVGYVESIVIGIAQAIAILPGISRSGATISTSVLLGIDRGQAARFSFLMVVPLIFGKIAKDILDGAFVTDAPPMLPLICGFTAAFVMGLFACKWMIALVRNCQLWWFSIYCFVVGTTAILASPWAAP